jgi:hypothetical protein
MDRGVPIERCWPRCAPPIRRGSIWSAPGKGAWTKLEKALLGKLWRGAGRVSSCRREMANSTSSPRTPTGQEPAPAKAGERAMRRRQLKWLWGRLKQLTGMKLTREELLMRRGVARNQARTADACSRSRWLRTAPPSREAAAGGREGRYPLRTNLTDDDPARLWGLYLQVVSVEEAFRNLKGDLAIRPIFHQDEA